MVQQGYTQTVASITTDELKNKDSNLELLNRLLGRDQHGTLYKENTKKRVTRCSVHHNVAVCGSIMTRSYQMRW
ncbi:hypothetical protein B0H10DRAFT_2120223 [Mycena sp. CBHHK59/15]|nr:hypothetical protein B0H10DRAFT_2120223 [Mycena sp. CBHHK59/15]